MALNKTCRNWKFGLKGSLSCRHGVSPGTSPASHLSSKNATWEVWLKPLYPLWSDVESYL